MSAPDDTIAALATPPGEGGIAIVRLSGPQALTVADKIIVTRGARPSQRPAGTFFHAHAADAQRVVVDEVLVLIMRAPRSYTGEDMVEIQGHGGRINAARVLRCALASGARNAQPGEFTRRAFLHGRIDLLQAEAVMDLVAARSERAAQAALEQLRGSLSHTLSPVYEALLDLTADLEALMNFPEDDLPPWEREPFLKGLDEQRTALDTLLRTWEEGHLLREGLTVVVTGKPNTGKSTLLNTLLGYDRAIVSAQPGTTRDSIEESWILNGIPLRLVDTAGLRQSNCSIEQDGVRRAKDLIGRADVQLYLLDVSQPLSAEIHAEIKALKPGRDLLLLNKCDLPRAFANSSIPFPGIELSLINKSGVTQLKQALAQQITARADLHGKPQAVISERHRVLITNALRELDEGRMLLSMQTEPEFVLVCEHLRESLAELGRILGKTHESALLDHIFSKFCIGK